MAFRYTIPEISAIPLLTAAEEQDGVCRISFDATDASREYLRKCLKYDHALYISGMDSVDPQDMTELNYQFLNTAAITDEEFRPAAVPKDWNYSQQAHEGYWLTKATEQAYYDFRANLGSQRDYFAAKLDDPELDITDRRRYRAQLIEKNFWFLFEPIYQKELQDKAEHILNKYRNANLLVAGDNRYLSDDLMRLLAVIVQPVSEYAYNVLMAEAMGGADYDGDMIKTISDPLMNRCVARNYGDNYENEGNLPLLKIPAAEPMLADAQDWKARFEKVKATFSSRVGQISNAALRRSIIAYDENSTGEEREQCRYLRIEPDYMTRKNDIQRILYSRNQEEEYTVDELYRCLDNMYPHEFRKLRFELTEAAKCAVALGKRQFAPEVLPGVLLELTEDVKPMERRRKRKWRWPWDAERD